MMQSTLVAGSRSQHAHRARHSQAVRFGQDDANKRQDKPNAEKSDQFTKQGTSAVANPPKRGWGNFGRSLAFVLAGLTGTVPTGYYFQNKIESQNTRIEQIITQSSAAQEELKRMSRNELQALVLRLNEMEARNQALSQELQALRAAAEMQLMPVIAEISPLNVMVEGGQGLGSGVWLRAQDGNVYILTNHHVVDDNSIKPEGEPATFNIRFFNGSDVREATRVEAQVVRASAAHDLALLKVSTPGFQVPSNIPTVRFRDIQANPLQVGERVIVVGTPRGLTDNVTTGTISHVERDLGEDFEPANIFIGVDAPINPGNSGGALYDEQGRLIGINTAGVRGSDGLGFSIRIDVVKQVLKGWGVDI